MPTPNQRIESVKAVKAGSFTKIGTCYTSKEVERKRKGKGKEGNGIAKHGQETLGQKGPEKNKSITEEEAKRLLKAVKHNEYNIVD